MQIEMVANGEAPEGEEQVLAQATLLLNQYKAERERLESEVNALTEELDAVKNRADQLLTENMQLRTDMQATDETCEELRQETAGLRGVFASIAVMVGAFEIAEPVRKRASIAEMIDDFEQDVDGLEQEIGDFLRKKSERNEP